MEPLLLKQVLGILTLKKKNIIATPNGSSSATKSEILRLKSNSLWVKQIDGNDVREMHLISK